MSETYKRWVAIAGIAVIIGVSLYLYIEYLNPESAFLRAGGTPFWTNLQNDSREVVIIKQGETKTIPVELHYWKGLRTLLGIELEEPEAEHGGLYNPPDGLEISFNLDYAYVEVDNGKVVDILTRKDVRLNEPSQIQYRFEGADMVVAEEIGNITISASKDVPAGDYIFGIATTDARVNSPYGGNSQLLAIKVVEEDAVIVSSSIIILTDDNLLGLNGNAIGYGRSLDKQYSEIAWDGENFYLVTLQKPGTYEDANSVENHLLVLDRNFNEVSSHHIGMPIYDFAVQDKTVYFLTETKLRLLDLSQEDPSIQKTGRSISFQKHVHDIMVKEDQAYLLDNIAVPLYIHLVDLPSLEVHTREFAGVNAHLVAQDVSEGKWYVLRSTSIMNGYFEDLLVFNAESGRLHEEPRHYGLVSLPRDSTHEPNLEDAYQISSILVDGQIVYALGYGFSLDGEERELRLGIYSLPEGGKRLSLIGLNDTSDTEGYRIATNIVLVDGKVYVGGNNGLYIIDVSDLGNPFVSDIIKVEASVRYIALV